MRLTFGAEGPKLEFDLLARPPNLAQWMDDVRRSLRIEDRAAPLAEEGLPEPDDMQASALEFDIRAAHADKADQLLGAAQRDLDKLANDIETLGIDILDSEYAGIAAAQKGDILQTEAGFVGSFPARVRRKIQADSSLQSFRTRTGLVNVPTKHSLWTWLFTTAATALAESFINGLFFGGERGYIGAVSFSFGIGFTVALLGTLTGIGFAQLSRREVWRRVLGGAWSLVMILIAFYFILLLGHYRNAIGTADPDATARASLFAETFTPLSTPSTVTLLFVNVAGLLLIGWKSVAMFGYLDLKRRETALEKATADANECTHAALADIGDSEADNEAGARAIANQAKENVTTAKANYAKCEMIVKDAASGIERLAHNQNVCEQRYREVVRAVHPYRGAFPRFAAPPPALTRPALAPSDSLPMIIAAIDARSVRLRDALPEVIEQIHERANASRERIVDLAVEIENELRRSRAGDLHVVRS